MKLRGAKKKEFVTRMARGRAAAKRKLNPKRKASAKRKATPKKRKSSIAPTKRRRNPAVSTNRKIDGAFDLYRRFSGRDPQYLETYPNPMHNVDVGMEIGKCDGILYTANRDGKNKRYVHEFSGRSRPILCSSWDGKQLFIVGGAYNFTDEGIVDR